MEEQTIKFLDKLFKLAIVLIAGILLFLAGQIIFQSKLLEQQNNSQFTVSGQGKVYAKPDVALVSLGVTTEAATVEHVTKNNTEKMNAVIQAVKDLGIDEKDIQTTNYNLSPLYNWTERTGRFLTGYTLSQNIQVKIKDFEKIGDVLAQSTTKGANQIGELQFIIDNPEELKDQARAKAVEQAKASAENLAKSSGIRLGKLINIYETYDPSQVSYKMAEGLGGADMAPAPVVQPGQQEIVVTINLTYRVK